jgi:molecular chaperone GrpE (heat shock protein)
MQAEIEAQRNRADALEREKESLAKQLNDTRDQLEKALSELAEAKRTLERMVPRHGFYCVLFEFLNGVWKHDSEEMLRVAEVLLHAEHSTCMYLLECI